MSEIQITCYGSRGSLPSPSRKGFSTVEYGGNTSSYHVQAGPFSIFLDMGSGVSLLGDDLMKSGQGFGKEHICLITHFHWDHIQGGPFCVPFFIPSNKFHFHSFAPAGMEGVVPLEKTIEMLLGSQQTSPHFPVAHGAMPCQKEYRAHRRQFSETFWYHCNPDGKLQFHPGSLVSGDTITIPDKDWIKITTIPLNHPDGCLGYRIEYLGKVAVYATDDEPLMYLNKELLKHAKDADWLLLDGQYTPGQLAGMCQIFGHGTPRRCVEQAKACGVKILGIHHHDPRHDDEKVSVMEGDARLYASEIGFDGKVGMAKEGQVWEI